MAFRFYEQHLGGRMAGLVRHADQPNPRLPADWHEKVLHARIEFGTTVLMGADVPHAEPNGTGSRSSATGSAHPGCFSISRKPHEPAGRESNRAHVSAGLGAERRG
jgi:hypothetical protein